MLVAVVVAVGGRPRPRGAQPAAQAVADREGADADDHHARGQVEPRVELIRDDELRERERDDAEREHPGRVRDRDGGAEDQRVARLPAGAGEVGRHHRLAVAGREGVDHAEHEREAERRRSRPRRSASRRSRSARRSRRRSWPSRRPRPARTRRAPGWPARRDRPIRAPRPSSRSGRRAASAGDRSDSA